MRPYEPQSIGSFCSHRCRSASTAPSMTAPSTNAWARSCPVTQYITQEGKRTAITGFPFFTQSGATVVVVVVRCLVLRSGLMKQKRIHSGTRSKLGTSCKRSRGRLTHVLHKYVTVLQTLTVLTAVDKISFYNGTLQLSSATWHPLAVATLLVRSCTF